MWYNEVRKQGESKEVLRRAFHDSPKGQKRGITMKNLATYYNNRAFAGAMIVIVQTSGTGKSATYSALVYTKAEAGALLERLARLEKTSPRYNARSGKTQHFRLDQKAVRLDYAQHPETAEVLTEWRRGEYDALREQFYAEQNACTLGKMCEADNLGKKVLSEGHFGEWLICRHFGIPWEYNTENWKEGADVRYGDATYEVKTVSKAPAQFQPNRNQYL